MNGKNNTQNPGEEISLDLEKIPWDLGKKQQPKNYLGWFGRKNGHGRSPWIPHFLSSRALNTFWGRTILAADPKKHGAVLGASSQPRSSALLPREESPVVGGMTAYFVDPPDLSLKFTGIGRWAAGNFFFRMPRGRPPLAEE